jgi:hypothetical protein
MCEFINSLLRRWSVTVMLDGKMEERQGPLVAASSSPLLYVSVRLGQKRVLNAIRNIGRFGYFPDMAITSSAV